MKIDPRDLQPEILKPTGRKYKSTIFIRIKENPDWEIFKNWLEQMPEEKAIVSTFQGQIEDTLSYQKKVKDKSGDSLEKVVVVVGFSHSFFRKVLLKSEISDNRISVKPTDESFLAGMKLRANTLHDYNYWRKDQSETNPSYPIVDKNFFNSSEFGNRQVYVPIDLAITMLSDDLELLNEHSDKVIQDLKNFEDYSFKEHGKVYKNDAGEALAPLDFVDGLSEDRSINTRIKESLVSEEWWSTIFKGDIGFKSYGSYLAFRKIEVDEEKFNEAIDELAGKIDKKVGDKKEFAKAMILGRFTDGTPLAQFGKAQNNRATWSDGAQDFPFSYADDPLGTLCPLHAHARRMRAGGKAKIARRSFRYQSEINQTGGMLFRSYQRSITEDFESLFNQMENRGAKDMLMYGPEDNIPENRKIDLPNMYGSKNSAKKITAKTLGGSVTIFRGGEYFYVPSVSFLKHLRKKLC